MSDKRIVINFDIAKTKLIFGFVPPTRAVVKSSKIVGLVETLNGNVIMSIRVKEDSPVVQSYVTNSFDEIASIMI